VRPLICIFAYVGCLFVPVTDFTCIVRIGFTPQLRLRRPAAVPIHLFCLLVGDQKSRDHCCVETGGAIFRHFQVRLCRIRIDSAVNHGETPSSEFTQCELCVIRRTKTVESICCAVRHTLDTAESCLTNDTLTTFSSSSDCYDD